MTSTWLQALLQREGPRLDAYAIVSKVRSGRRLRYSDFRTSIARLVRRWNADRIIIERAGTGITLGRELFREECIRGKIEPYNPACRRPSASTRRSNG